MTTAAEPDARGRELLEQAFAAARASGKDDWQRINLGELKNRILQLSDRSFRETDFGAETFREFVARYPDLLRVDESRRPLTAELLVPDGLQGPSARPGRERIRPDLWNSIIDYRSGNNYVWDASELRAVAVSPESPDSRPQLPTLTPDEIGAWRREFIDNKFPEGVYPHQVQVWADRGLSVAGLPPALRGEWNAFQRDQIVDRLSTWFLEQNLTVPTDILRSEAPAARTATSSELRSFAMRCLELMSEAEIAELRIPLHIAQRVPAR